MKVARILTIILLTLLLGVVHAKPKKQVRVANGTWGGPNISMNIGETSTTIEFGCANGAIEGPLMIDVKGQFKWKGTFASEHAGPARIDETNAADSVVYSGSIKGSSMTLVIRREGEEKPIDTFTLIRGAIVRLHKCM